MVKNLLRICFIVFSVCAFAQTPVLEAELELLHRLSGQQETSRFLSIGLLKEALDISRELFAVYYLPGEKELRIITGDSVVTLSEESGVKREALDSELAMGVTKVSIIDAFSLVSLQTKDEVLGIYLEHNDSEPFWQVITETKVFVIGGTFPSTISVSSTKNALIKVEEKLKREKEREDNAKKPDTPGRPDEPGRPDDPGKPGDTPGKGNGKK